MELSGFLAAQKKYEVLMVQCIKSKVVRFGLLTVITLLFTVYVFFTFGTTIVIKENITQTQTDTMDHAKILRCGTFEDKY